MDVSIEKYHSGKWFATRVPPHWEYNYAFLIKPYIIIFNLLILKVTKLFWNFRYCGPNINAVKFDISIIADTPKTVMVKFISDTNDGSKTDVGFKMNFEGKIHIR